MHNSNDGEQNKWWAACSKRVDELWDWMHGHNAETSAWWNEQWRVNKNVGTNLNNFEKRLRSVESMSVRVGMAGILGAMIGAAVMTWIVDKL